MHQFQCSRQQWSVWIDCSGFSGLCCGVTDSGVLLWFSLSLCILMSNINLVSVPLWVFGCACWQMLHCRENVSSERLMHSRLKIWAAINLNSNTALRLDQQFTHVGVWTAKFLPKWTTQKKNLKIMFLLVIFLQEAVEETAVLTQRSFKRGVRWQREQKLWQNSG